MTPEEIQRTIDFILQNQADSQVRMERLEKQHERMERQQDRFDQQHERLMRAQEATRQDIDTLVRVTHDLVRVSRQTIHRVRNLESRE